METAIDLSEVDGDLNSVNFSLDVKQLRELMELRGGEAVTAVGHMGGVTHICKRLRTSEMEGESCHHCLLPIQRQSIANSLTQLSLLCRPHWEPFKLGN